MEGFFFRVMLFNYVKSLLLKCQTSPYNFQKLYVVIYNLSTPPYIFFSFIKNKELATTTFKRICQSLPDQSISVECTKKDPTKVQQNTTNYTCILLLSDTLFNLLQYMQNFVKNTITTHFRSLLLLKSFLKAFIILYTLFI